MYVCTFTMHARIWYPYIEAWFFIISLFVLVFTTHSHAHTPKYLASALCLNRLPCTFLASVSFMFRVGVGEKTYTPTPSNDWERRTSYQYNYNIYKHFYMCLYTLCIRYPMRETWVRLGSIVCLILKILNDNSAIQKPQNILITITKI